MNTFTKKTFIECTKNELFDFHLDTNNLTKITPKNISLNLLTHNFTPAQSKTMELVSTKYFIPMFWKIKIEKLQRPDVLVDLALKSPFKFWRHEHRFEETTNGCNLIDIIEFKMPFGFLGNLLKNLIIKDLETMFEYRHKKTKEILETKDKV